MTCQIGYASEYIKGCDISKFGEGCESCVPLFKSSLIIPIIAVLFCTIVLTILIIILRKYYSFPQDGGKHGN